MEAIDKTAKKHGCVENSQYWYRFNSILDARDFCNELYAEHGMVASIHKQSNTVFIKERA